jgi:hypothetical protein
LSNDFLDLNKFYADRPFLDLSSGIAPGYDPDNNLCRNLQFFRGLCGRDNSPPLSGVSSTVNFEVSSGFL